MIFTKKIIRFFVPVLIIALLMAGCTGTNPVQDQSNVGTAVGTAGATTGEAGETQPSNTATQGSTEAQPSGTTVQENSGTHSAGTSSAPSGLLKVHFIDVGQGDSELIQTPDDKTMLIDTGTNASTTSLINYLRSRNVSRIDYLVLTHPHEDHIGGADAVIKDFEVINIYMPKVTATTKTFEDVVNAMRSKGLKASQPAPGTSFALGTANCKILGPINTDTDNLNTYSIILKLTYGINSFIFTGDAQVSNEEDMINRGYNLSADVLKVGHHGSKTSTSQDFLDAANPKYAVISCAKGNDYGHPHQETMDKLAAKHIPVYRTDECGTIISTSDGRSISFDVKPGDYNNGDIESGVTDNRADGGKSVAGSGETEAKPPADTTPGTDVAARVDDPSPVQNTRIHLTVTGPRGASYTAVCHYKSKDTVYNGKVGSPLSINIGRAAKGFTVVIDVTINSNGKTYTARTSFTPR